MSDLERGLLAWSEGLTVWQRDLLRRLADGEELGIGAAREYADFVEQSELMGQLPWFEEPQRGSLPSFSPLEATHLTSTVVGGDPVAITRVEHVVGANDLAPGATLDFEPTGLTVVAGKNGSGKSGYTRILKQVAASRASETVLPNAFNSGLVPQAAVSYQVGSGPAENFLWEAGSESGSIDLNRVRVFDSRSASAHLAGAAEVVYIPPALRILGGYTRCLQEISALIDSDMQQLQLQKREWPDLNVGVGQELFGDLGGPMAYQVLSRLSALTEDEVKELAGIPAQLHDLKASNPAALAVQARQRAGQLMKLADALDLAATKLSPEMIAVSQQIRSAVSAAKTRADDARAVFPHEGELAGTGEDEWQTMWLAAVDFARLHSENDFLDEVDPLVCPLCQQALGTEAHTRLKQFAEFMDGEAQAALAETMKLRKADIESLEALRLDSLIAPDLLDMIATYHPAMRESLPLLIDQATALRDLLLLDGVPDPVLDDDEDDDDDDDETESSAAGELGAVVADLRKSAASETAKADALADTDRSVAAADKLLARQADLSVRANLLAARAEISQQHDRVIQLGGFNRAKSKCATTSASRKNSELSRAYVEKVCHQFEVEATALGLDRVPVELVFDRSARGISYIKLCLKSAPQVPVAQVLSEGEQRVTAIAGFFADLTESGDNSTLIFDDPVSSLDEEYRVKVARRLLDEADNRQVLVFTHDFSFVQYLYEEKKIKDLERLSVGAEPFPAIGYLHIARAQEGAGLPTTAAQWRHVGIKDRVGRIKQRTQEASALYANGDLLGYEPVARDIVGSLRETWEAFVEIEFLNNVVSRHERAVRTQLLRKLTDISEADIATIDLGMTLDSRFMTGHADPIGDGSAMMTPSELQGEVTRFVEFRAAVLARRK